MRRVGVSAFIISQERQYGRTIVELYDDRVCNYYPLDPDNLEMCEWLGGTLFLTAFEPHELPAHGSIAQLIDRMQECTVYPTKAYHLPAKIYRQGEFQEGQLIQLTDNEF